MKRCPISYDLIDEQALYSSRGLRMLSPKLAMMSPLNLSAEEQRQQAIERVGKMSIQGMQKKLSAQLCLH